MLLILVTLLLAPSILACLCPDGQPLQQTRPPCTGGLPVGDDCPGGGGGVPGGGGLDLSGSGPWACSLLGDVGFTDVAGTVTDGVINPISLPIGENIFGPFEAGFGAEQARLLEGLGCNPASGGYVDGGIDTYLSDEIIAYGCNIQIPRYDNGILISLIDACGGHTKDYHFHQRLRCLYIDEGIHSIKVGHGLDDRSLYGKWENFTNTELPLLDACGGHWGFTPDSPSAKIYHYHMQDHAPFTFGCYGPNPDNSLVTVAQCRALYTGANGCGGTDIVNITTASGTNLYDHWCPCFDNDGSNVGTVPLSVFGTADAAGPGADYVESTSSVEDMSSVVEDEPTSSVEDMSSVVEDMSSVVEDMSSVIENSATGIKSINASPIDTGLSPSDSTATRPTFVGVIMFVLFSFFG